MVIFKMLIVGYISSRKEAEEVKEVAKNFVVMQRIEQIVNQSLKEKLLDELDKMAGLK
jgi:hypothetical protein